jgi:hypothetical protein
MRPAAAAAVLAAALVLATSAGAADRPRYDVPRGYTRCPDAEAWNGFFKWASARRATLPPHGELHARLRQAGDPRRHAATPARLSLSDPVPAKRAGRHLRQPTYVPPPPRRAPLLRDGVGAPGRARPHSPLTVCGWRRLASPARRPNSAPHPGQTATAAKIRPSVDAGAHRHEARGPRRTRSSGESLDVLLRKTRSPRCESG